jgi:hypothetical protein
MTGKSRAAQNARRHGLSIPVWVDPKLAAEVEELAVEIAGAAAPALIKERARAIAEAQIQIQRVRQAQCRLLEGTPATPQASQPAEAERFARIVSELAGPLNSLDRYERRALSRRKTAVEVFDAACQVLAESKGAD